MLVFSILNFFLHDGFLVKLLKSTRTCFQNCGGLAHTLCESPFIFPPESNSYMAFALTVLQSCGQCPLFSPRPPPFQGP